MNKFESIQKQLTDFNAGLLTKTELEVISVYKQIDKEISSVLVEIYKEYDLPKLTRGKPDGAKTMAFMRRKVTTADKRKITRLNAMQLEIKKRVNPLLLSKDRHTEKMAKIFLQNGYYQNAWAVENTTGVALSFTVLDDEALKQIIMNPLSVLSDKTLREVDALRVGRAETIARINREIEIGLGRGDDLKTVSRRIDILLGFRDSQGKLIKGGLRKRGKTWQSLRIARTEAMRALSLGHNKFFRDTRKQLKDEGLEPKLQYVATLDARTRPQSAAMDGQFSNAKGEFMYQADAKNMFPGGWFVQHNTGNPAYDINDRCTTITVMEGFEPVVRRSKTEGVIPNIKFDEWAKKSGISKSIYGEQYYFA